MGTIYVRINRTKTKVALNCNKSFQVNVSCKGQLFTKPMIIDANQHLALKHVFKIKHIPISPLERKDLELAIQIIRISEENPNEELGYCAFPCSKLQNDTVIDDWFVLPSTQQERPIAIHLSIHLNTDKSPPFISHPAQWMHSNPMTLDLYHQKRNPEKTLPVLPPPSVRRGSMVTRKAPPLPTGTKPFRPPVPNQSPMPSKEKIPSIPRPSKASIIPHPKINQAPLNDERFAGIQGLNNLEPLPVNHDLRRQSFSFFKGRKSGSTQDSGGEGYTLLD